MDKPLAGLALALAALASPASATTAYTSQASFAAALDGAYTLVNLDAPPLLFPAGYHVEDAGPAAAFQSLGIDFFGFNAQVAAGQNRQTPTDRDRLIFNGKNFGGEIAVDFAAPVNGVGAFANNDDFGRILAYSEPGLGGTLLGSAQFGPGGFGGVTSAELIRSARFTCDGNSDFLCGVYDIQLGTFAAAAIPEPGSCALLLAGLGWLGFGRRRKFGQR